MDVEDRVKTVETWMRRVWSQKDASAIDEMFAANGSASGLGDDPLMGPADFKKFHASLLEIIDELRVEIRDIVDDGERTAMSCTLHAKCKRTGNPVTITGGFIASFQDGQLCDCENHWEFMALFEQLGMLPKNSFSELLSGRRFV